MTLKDSSVGEAGTSAALAVAEVDVGEAKATVVRVGGVVVMVVKPLGVFAAVAMPASVLTPRRASVVSFTLMDGFFALNYW